MYSFAFSLGWNKSRSIGGIGVESGYLTCSYVLTHVVLHHLTGHLLPHLYSWKVLVPHISSYHSNFPFSDCLQDLSLPSLFSLPPVCRSILLCEDHILSYNSFLFSGVFNASVDSSSIYTLGFPLFWRIKEVQRNLNSQSTKQMKYPNVLG